jgi:hypothetical protein
MAFIVEHITGEFNGKPILSVWDNSIDHNLNLTKEDAKDLIKKLQYGLAWLEAEEVKTLYPGS